MCGDPHPNPAGLFLQLSMMCQPAGAQSVMGMLEHRQHACWPCLRAAIAVNRPASLLLLMQRLLSRNSWGFSVFTLNPKLSSKPGQGPLLTASGHHVIDDCLSQQIGHACKTL